MSCGVGCRMRLDPKLLWLWYRLGAIAPIRPLAWELPYATGAALKRQEKKKKREREREIELGKFSIGSFLSGTTEQKGKIDMTLRTHHFIAHLFYLDFTCFT